MPRKAHLQLIKTRGSLFVLFLHRSAVEGRKLCTDFGIRSYFEMFQKMEDTFKFCVECKKLPESMPDPKSLRRCKRLKNNNRTVIQWKKILDQESLWPSGYFWTATPTIPCCWPFLLGLVGVVAQQHMEGQMTFLSIIHQANKRACDQTRKLWLPALEQTSISSYKLF